jgi:hypothetical protein
VKQLRMLSANAVATCFVIDLPDPGGGLALSRCRSTRLSLLPGTDWHGR